MLKNEPSFASLLIKQSPAMHCGHGWIMGKDGKRWHPSRSQVDLLAGLSSHYKEDSWLSKLCRKLHR
ncbi:phage filamentation protein Fil family protein [Enterobacter sichuanensis]|uniref:phage filamentation protein Fil family protein n=1 Tax=Enterobacter sichuanensis TaxID=2071710 RepID=UPI002B1F2D39|nr:phage filamentation protein Fil family protein [Enterobacter sichuanensis]MEA5170577.1 phage filamentation protein Fil family protein [Enterobacter sichuanensis]